MCSGALPNQSAGYQTIAGAGWIDGLRFAPGRQPAFASFAVYVNGGVFASRAGGNTVSSGRVSARASLTVWNALSQSGTDAVQQQVAAAAGSPIVVEEASVNRLLRVMIPVPRIDRTTLTFNYFLNVFAGAESGGQQTAFGGGEAQFMNSAGLESILFFDEDMQQITEGVNYEFLGGTVLTPNTVVPEPQTWMLLGVGLLAIGAHARSRQGSARQGATA